MEAYINNTKIDCLIEHEATKVIIQFTDKISIAADEELSILIEYK